jgi:isopentenyl phosphate kinase
MLRLITYVIVVKLGGSVITEKGRDEYRVRMNTLLRLAEELSGSSERFVVVHGAGPFGHRKVRELGINRGDDDIVHKIVEIQRSTRVLNSKVLEALAELNPVSFPPYSLFSFSGSRITLRNLDLLKYYYDRGFTPVTYGDICFDDELGYYICSGDRSVLELSRLFRPDKAIFVVDVDGIYDRDPKERGASLLPIAERRDILFENNERDVTGGMSGKFDVMLELSKLTKVLVINGKVRNRLFKAVNGEDVRGTEVRYEA